MEVFPKTNEECTLELFYILKKIIDDHVDKDKTGLNTIDSLRKGLDEVAAKTNAYYLGVFDIDNFKKYNSPPLDYE